MHALSTIVLVFGVLLAAPGRAVPAPGCGTPLAAVTPDGGRYSGALKQGLMHGRGCAEWPDGKRYEGEFEDGVFHGSGELTLENGDRYTGGFARGRYHGMGKLVRKNGDFLEGEFVDGELHGRGVRVTRFGGRQEGTFKRGQLHGKGISETGYGLRYEGEFKEGVPEGEFVVTGRNGYEYRGTMKAWSYEGAGTLRLGNGDTYRGSFKAGLYDGEGTLTYARPQDDGRTVDKGVWKFGRLQDGREDVERANIEAAMYRQRTLFDAALADIAPRDEGRINLFLMSVAGDGSQEVFRREVEFVDRQFSERFGLRGRSLMLVNSRNSLDRLPMATRTSITEGIQTIAARMDKAEDILFLFITSHGSESKEITLSQRDMALRPITDKLLANALKASGIRWKVIVLSACHAGGFIDTLKDDHTLILAAARHDRKSFGCADDSEFTYFGRALFKEALPDSTSFQEAFRKAEKLIEQWERDDMQKEKAALDKTSGATGAGAAKESEIEHSLPQMVSPAPIEAHLKRWWEQRAAAARAQAPKR
jgi:hypothetical protein